MKKNSKTKRVFATVLSLILMLSILAPTALATEERNEGYGGRFLRISIFCIDLSIATSGLSSSYSDIVLTYSSDKAELIMDLQQLKSGVWTTIKSWNTSGSGTVYLDKDWYVVSGYSYRVYTTAKVYNSSGTLLETAYATSNSVFY